MSEHKIPLESLDDPTIKSATVGIVELPQPIQYKCPIHGTDVGWITYFSYEPAKAYCQKCYWDNVIKKNCRELEEI